MITDVFATVAIGAGILTASGMIAARRRLELPVWRTLPLFCSMAAWMTPMVAFYKRDSLWAVAASFVFSAFGSRLIYRYHLASSARDIASAEPQAELFHARRLISLVFAALLLQVGALSLLASLAQPATVLIGGAIIVISFFHQTATPLNQSQRRPQIPTATLRFSISIGLAIILVAASLTPYLAAPTEYARATGTGAANLHSIPKPTGTPAKSKASFLQSAAPWLRRFLAHSPQSAAKGRLGKEDSSGQHPYPALQALFGEGEKGKESTSLQKKLQNDRLTVLVADDSFHGVILRPKLEEHVTIVPPLPTQRIFDGKVNERRVDPVSIPFYGAYWFFRASDGALPPDAVESRGDAASTTFKTTDYSAISMEARQNFGSLIELSCCKAIELVISNGDRRPDTVAVELILTNTRLPHKPQQSLGLVPVKSTLHWYPGDKRAPVQEALTFRVPENATIQSFDEVTIRFELRSPRERWSAPIAVEKFRLIPRGL